MRLFRCLLLLIAVFTMSFGGSKPPEDKVLISKIAEIMQCLNQNHGKVWQGYDLSKVPLVVTTKEGRIYGFNFSSKNPVWKTIHLANQAIVYTDKDEWNLSQVSMQDKFVLDDQEVFVFNLGVMQQPGPDFQPLFIMIHELFHRYQFANFALDEDKGDYKDRNNVENLSLAHMEEQLLINYLSSESKEERMRFLKSFLGINTFRKQLIAPSSVILENHQQKMEGLADYAAIKTLDVFNLYETFSADKHLLAALKSYSQANRSSDNVVKWRHYGVGAAIAYALDELDVSDWKFRVQKGEISLSDALAEALLIEESYLEGIKEKVLVHPEFLNLKEKFLEEIVQNKNQIASILNDYSEAEGLRIKIDKPNCGINGGGRSQGIYHLEDGSTVSLNDSSYSATTDNLWKLEVLKIGFLFQYRNGFREFKLQDDPILLLDGKQLQIASLKQTENVKHFEEIELKSSCCLLKSLSRPGIVRIRDNCLEIIFKDSPNYKKCN